MSDNVKLIAAIAALAVCAALAIFGIGGMKSSLDGATSTAAKQEAGYIPSSADEQTARLHEATEEIDRAKSAISDGARMAEDSRAAVDRRAKEHKAISREVNATMAPIRSAAASQAADMEAEHARMRARFEANNH